MNKSIVPREYLTSSKGSMRGSIASCCVDASLVGIKASSQWPSQAEVITEKSPTQLAAIMFEVRHSGMASDCGFESDLCEGGSEF